MKIHLILTVFLVASAYSSKDLIVKNFKAAEPEPLCQYQGQFLLHGENRCKYIRCTHGPARVQKEEDEGRYSVFFGVEQTCPYGTAVSRDFYKERGYGYKQDDGFMLDESRLCTERITQFHPQGDNDYYDQCLVEAPRYLPYFPPQMFPVLYHGHNQVPGSYPVLPNTYPNDYGAHPFNRGQYPGIIQYPYGYRTNSLQRPTVYKAEEPVLESPKMEESYQPEVQSSVDIDEADVAPVEEEQSYSPKEGGKPPMEEQQQEENEKEQQEIQHKMQQEMQQEEQSEMQQELQQEEQKERQNDEQQEEQKLDQQKDQQNEQEVQQQEQEQEQEEPKIKQTVHDAPPVQEHPEMPYPGKEESNQEGEGN